MTCLCVLLPCFLSSFLSFPSRCLLSSFIACILLAFLSFLLVRTCMCLHNIATHGIISTSTEQLSNLIRLGGGSVCALENDPRSPETQSNSSNNQTILHCPSSSSRQQKRKTFVVSDQPSLEGTLNLVALHGSTPGVGAGARCDGGAVIVFSCWLLDCISEYKYVCIL